MGGASPFLPLFCSAVWWQIGWIQGANHKIAAGRKGGKKKSDNIYGYILLNEQSVQLWTHPSDDKAMETFTCHPCSLQCPLGCHPSTVPARACGQPQPSAKNFCCRITGHGNLPHPVSVTQKPPPPNIFTYSRNSFARGQERR